MKHENLYPIGSVVLLEDSNKRLMITGRLQRQVETNRLWDYSGCFYPEGIIDPSNLFLFDHSQIAATFFIGFQDKEGLDFQQELMQKYEELHGE